MIVRGLMNFVPAEAYHFCLNLPIAFSQPGKHSFGDPCKPNVLVKMMRSSMTRTYLRQSDNWRVVGIVSLVRIIVALTDIGVVLRRFLLVLCVARLSLGLLVLGFARHSLENFKMCIRKGTN